MLKEIDDKISHEEVEYVFNKVDEDKNGSIDFKEFKKYL